MPIYDYRCKQCGRVSEILVRNIHEDKVKCPICYSQSIERLVSVSYGIKPETKASGATCCGRTERCEAPPCSTDEVCHSR